MAPRLVQPAPGPVSDLQKKLLALRGKLEMLKLNLAKLSSRLKSLRSTLRPQPVTAKSKELAEKIKRAAEQNPNLIECYNLLNTWIKTPPTDSGKVLQGQLVALGQKMSALFTDSKINIADIMVQRLSRDSLRVVLAALYALINNNKNLTRDEDAYLDLAALSINLRESLNIFSGSNQAEINAMINQQQAWAAGQNIQGWIDNIVNYYQKKQRQLMVIKLKDAKNLHYFASQLCIFFAAVIVGGLRESPYIWIETVLPVLQMSDEHRIEIVRAVIGYEKSYAKIPEFMVLVRNLKMKYPAAARPAS
jgi:hypothetical protein